MKRIIFQSVAFFLLFDFSLIAQQQTLASAKILLPVTRLLNVKTNKSELINLLYEKQKLHVLVFLSPECPLCKNYSVALNELQKKYLTVQVTGIVPGKAYSSHQVKEFVEKYKINFNIYIDSPRTLSDHLHATVTPEVFLVQSDGFIVYYGAIDNWVKELGMHREKATQFYLQDAIDRTLANKPVASYFVKPVGCFINDY